MTVLTQPTWRRRFRQFLPAIFFWIVLVLVNSTSRAPGGFERTWVKGLEGSMLVWFIWALLTPLIILVDRWLPVSRVDLFKRFVLHIPLSFIFAMLRWYLFYAVSPVLMGSAPAGYGSPVEALQISFRGVFQSVYLGYWIVILIYISSDYYKHVKERELRGTELERLVSESRLKTLRAQLHPHFLFNALNTISAHVERSPRAARQTLDDLGEILRLSLAHSNDQEVPLAQEIAFVEHYLKIQKARFEERLAAVVKADPDTLNALVPTFILQPLVENAIRHGMSPRLEKSCVQVLAWRENGQLRLRVQDDGAGLPRDWNPSQSAGIGMSNTRERLRHLYGDQGQTFEVLSEPGKGVRVDLRIPFREAALPDFGGGQPVPAELSARPDLTTETIAAIGSQIPLSAARDRMEATHYILS